MNYLFNKNTVILFAIFTIVGSTSLSKKVESASQENITEISINQIQIAQSSQPIETQPGPDGTEVQLLKTKIIGPILHVSLLYLPLSDGTDSDSFLIEKVNYIDDNTAQQYGVLKNESGGYLASPKHRAAKTRFSVRTGERTPVWFKFPAPSPETQTISINIPEVGPFVGVPVQR